MMALLKIMNNLVDVLKLGMLVL